MQLLHINRLRNRPHLSANCSVQEVAPCICEAVSVLKRLPELRDRVELLQDYEIYQQTAADIQTLLTELTESYNVIVK